MLRIGQSTLHVELIILHVEYRTPVESLICVSLTNQPFNFGLLSLKHLVVCFIFCFPLFRLKRLCHKGCVDPEIILGLW